MSSPVAPMLSRPTRRSRLLWESDGVECLPLIMVDGEIVSKGMYLDKDALGAKVGIEIAAGAAEPCCGPSDVKTEAKEEETSACCS